MPEWLGRAYRLSYVVIAGLVPAIQFLEAWTTGTSPVVTMDGLDLVLAPTVQQRFPLARE